MEEEDKRAEDGAVGTNLGAQGEELGRETKMWSKQEEERKEKKVKWQFGEESFQMEGSNCVRDPQEVKKSKDGKSLR